MLSASILKIFYWPGARYDLALLVQALIMVVVQLVLLKVGGLCDRVVEVEAVWLMVSHLTRSHSTTDRLGEEKALSGLRKGIVGRGGFGEYVSLL